METHSKKEKNKNDVLKEDQYEPKSLIKLNPKMMNTRIRDKEVKSLETVVSNKKTDKRKLKESML